MTAKERVFRDAYLASGDPIKAAAVAGYARPERDAVRTMSRPEVHAEIFQMHTDRVLQEGVPRAYQTLMEVMAGKHGAKASDRRAAAKDMLAEAARLSAILQDAGADAAEMTAGDLRATLARLQAELATLDDIPDAETIEDEPEPSLFD